MQSAKMCGCVRCVCVRVRVRVCFVCVFCVCDLYIMHTQTPHHIPHTYIYVCIRTLTHTKMHTQKCTHRGDIYILVLNSIYVYIYIADERGGLHTEAREREET